MPPRYVVRGGAILQGTVRPSGNKNAALPAIAAAVLADGPVELDNIPRIRDVETSNLFIRLFDALDELRDG